MIAEIAIEDSNRNRALRRHCQLRVVFLSSLKPTVSSLISLGVWESLGNPPASGAGERRFKSGRADCSILATVMSSSGRERGWLRRRPWLPRATFYIG